jgi:hypothetical protein
MGKHESQEMKQEAVKLLEAGKTHREIRDGLQGFRPRGSYSRTAGNCKSQNAKRL